MTDLFAMDQAEKQALRQEVRRLEAMNEGLIEAGRSIVNERNELGAHCPLCGHRWSQHDPEDGCCDSPSSERIGVCECGRDMAWMHQKIAGLSRAALEAATDELRRNGEDPQTTKGKA